VLLRCTTRLLTLLGERNLVLVDDPPHHDDWYANLIWLDRRKCLLLTHAGTLFPVFIADVRTGDLRPPGALAVARIEAALADEGLPGDALGPLDPWGTDLARTASRRILGFMNETALACRYAVEAAGGLEDTDVAALDLFLRRQLHNVDGYRQPIELVRTRLER
jgi:hypothetical protein